MGPTPALLRYLQARIPETEAEQGQTSTETCIHTYYILYTLLIAILLIFYLVHELLPSALLYCQCPSILAEVILMFSCFGAHICSKWPHLKVVQYWNTYSHPSMYIYIDLACCPFFESLYGPHMHTYCTVAILDLVRMDMSALLYWS